MEITNKTRARTVVAIIILMLIMNAAAGTWRHDEIRAEAASWGTTVTDKKLNKYNGKSYYWRLPGVNMYACTGYTEWALNKVYGIKVPSYPLVKDLRNDLLAKGYKVAASGGKRNGKYYTSGTVKPGDIAFFYSANKGQWMHVAVVGGAGSGMDSVLHHNGTVNGIHYGGTIRSVINYYAGRKGAEYQLVRVLSVKEPKKEKAENMKKGSVSKKDQKEMKKTVADTAKQAVKAANEAKKKSAKETKKTAKETKKKAAKKASGKKENSKEGEKDKGNEKSAANNSGVSKLAEVAPEEISEGSNEDAGYAGYTNEEARLHEGAEEAFYGGEEVVTEAYEGTEIPPYDGVFDGQEASQDVDEDLESQEASKDSGEDPEGREAPQDGETNEGEEAAQDDSGDAPLEERNDAEGEEAPGDEEAPEDEVLDTYKEAAGEAVLAAALVLDDRLGCEGDDMEEIKEEKSAESGKSKKVTDRKSFFEKTIVRKETPKASVSGKRETAENKWQGASGGVSVKTETLPSVKKKKDKPSGYKRKTEREEDPERAEEAEPVNMTYPEVKTDVRAAGESGSEEVVTGSAGESAFRGEEEDADPKVGEGSMLGLLAGTITLGVMLVIYLKLNGKKIPKKKEV